jgi:protein TonB
MLNPLLRTLLPVTASVLVHAGMVMALVLGPGPGVLPDRMPVLVAEMVEAEAPPPTPVAPPPPPAPRPVVPDRRPLTPPRPIATPLPLEPPAPLLPARPEPEPVAAPPPPAPEPARPEPAPEPPKTIIPEAPAPVAKPSPPVSPRPEPPRALASAPAPPSPPVTPQSAAGSVSSVAEPGPGEFAPRAPATTSGAGPSASPPRGSDVAALPPDGVTRQAIPRGGYQYRPRYPSRARALGAQGTTLLHVLVSDRGRVAEVVVKQSAGHPDLDQAAVDAVRRWRFEPARRGDEPVAMWVQLPFEFRLR